MDIIYIKKLKMAILLEGICNLISKIQGVLSIPYGARCEGGLPATSNRRRGCERIKPDFKSEEKLLWHLLALYG